MPLLPFKCTKLLAVEGEDEVNFFKKLLEHTGLADDVEIRKAGGKDSFKNLLPAFKITSGFKNIESIIIVRDADDNARAAFQSVKNVLEKNQFIAPDISACFTDGKPKIGIFILPDNNSPGMLEDLCLSTVKTHDGMTCVERFIKCTGELKDKPANPSKAMVQAFLATKTKIAQSLGVAAQKGYWDLESIHLKPLIEFIKQM